MRNEGETRQLKLSARQTCSHSLSLQRILLVHYPGRKSGPHSLPVSLPAKGCTSLYCSWRPQYVNSSWRF